VIESGIRPRSAPRDGGRLERLAEHVREALVRVSEADLVLQSACMASRAADLRCTQFALRGRPWRAASDLERSALALAEAELQDAEARAALELARNALARAQARGVRP
jgi:hypothetical protein